METAAGRFSAGEVRTLASLAATFVPGTDDRQVADLAAQALLRAADPAQITQLRLVLRLLEVAPANLLSGGAPRAFSAMGHADRERLLLRWAHSPIALKRTGFQAFRKLLTFLAYAMPGPDGRPNPLLAEIGYEPDRPPVTSDRTPVRPFLVDRSPGAEPVVLEADVIVVGSGAGGGVVAAELAAAGR